MLRRPCPASSAKRSPKPADGDTVLLATGRTTRLPFTGITIDKAIDFGGRSGRPAILVTTDTPRSRCRPKAHATLHDLRIEGGGGLRARLRGRPNGSSSPTQARAPNRRPANSVKARPCATASAGRWKPRRSGRRLARDRDRRRRAKTRTRPVVLRNVTAIAADAAGQRDPRSLGTFGAELHVDAANVIARSVNDTDIVAEIEGGGLPKAHAEHHQLRASASSPTTRPMPTVTAARHRAATSDAAPAFVDAGRRRLPPRRRLADARRRRRRPPRSAPSTSTATTAPRPGASAPARSPTWAPSSGRRPPPARRRRLRRRRRSNRASPSSGSSACAQQENRHRPPAGRSPGRRDALADRQRRQARPAHGARRRRT